MLTIELMGYSAGCLMKCPTCPGYIQKMDGSYRHNMVLAFKKIQDKLGDNQMYVSIMDDFSMMPIRIKEFGITKAKSLGSYTQFPIDKKAFEETLKSVSSTNPKSIINLITLHKESKLKLNYVDEVAKMAELFFKTKLPAFQLSFASNSMLVEKYMHESKSMKTSDNLFYKKLAKKIGTKARSKSKYEEDRYLSMYSSIFKVKRKEKAIVIMRRVMCKLKNGLPVDELRHHRIVAESYARQTRYSNPDNVILTLTPMGVKMNHSSLDVDNPFLWITYKELFFYLHTCPNMRSLCRKLIKGIKISLNSKNLNWTKTDEETIDAMGNERMEIIRQSI